MKHWPGLTAYHYQALRRTHHVTEGSVPRKNQAFAPVSSCRFGYNLIMPRFFHGAVAKCMRFAASARVHFSSTGIINTQRYAVCATMDNSGSSSKSSGRGVRSGYSAAWGWRHVSDLTIFSAWALRIELPVVDV